MSGARSRRKGANFERWLARTLRAVLGNSSIRRGFQSRSGEEAPDVDVPGWWLEAKHHRRVNVGAALAQAVAAAPPGRVPVAICKNDREPPIVAMRFDDFLAVLAQQAAPDREDGR